ncbi:hypothetical protein [Enterococcus faecium]|uniref:hypothetical protein n=1 Tax=Enterococcus faecium TaxID=1352 RepID=UPI001F250EF4|nr:hypothetical protein [Enterococcus faecium]
MSKENSNGQHMIMPFISYDYQDKNKALTNFALGMYNKTLTMFDYSNLPETIPFKEVEKILQQRGYAIITEVKGELYAFYGGLSGFDAYYQPTHAIVANPYLNFNATLEIGKDCILIKNDDMRVGLHYLFQRYGYQIVENELTMVVNNFNSRMKTIITATDDNTAESAKEYLQDVIDGKTGVVMGSKLFDGIKMDSPNHNTSSNVSDLIELEQYMKATLLNEIGLDANYNMKRERLTDGEVNQNDDALYPLVDNMLDNRKEGWEAVNELYGTNVSVEFSSIWRVKQQELERHIENVTETTVDNEDGTDIRESLEEGREDVTDKLDLDPEETPTEALEDDTEPVQDTEEEVTEEDEPTEDVENSETVEETEEDDTEDVEDPESVEESEEEETPTEDEEEPTEDVQDTEDEQEDTTEEEDDTEEEEDEEDKDNEKK